MERVKMIRAYLAGEKIPARKIRVMEVKDGKL